MMPAAEQFAQAAARNGLDVAAKAAVADLKTADEVFVMSKVEAGGTTAYLVVVPRH